MKFHRSPRRLSVRGGKAAIGSNPNIEMPIVNPISPPMIEPVNRLGFFPLKKIYIIGIDSVRDSAPASIDTSTMSLNIKDRIVIIIIKTIVVFLIDLIGKSWVFLFDITWWDEIA